MIPDIMMPNMDGFTFRNLLKLIPYYHLTPFLFISAKVLSDDKIKGCNTGVDDYITKPFDKDELIARRNSLWNNLKSRKFWLQKNPEIIALPSQDANQQILKDIENYVVNHLKDEDMNLAALSPKLSYSQRSLSNLVQKVTGLTLVQYILEIKLLEAYKMVQNREFRTINEVRYAIGINSISYFNRVFKNRFGISPSQLKEKTKLLFLYYHVVRNLNKYLKKRLCKPL